MRRFGKMTVWAAAVLILLLASTACSNNNEPATASPADSASASPSASASAPASASSDAGDAPASPSASAPLTDAVLEGTGTYNGQIDNHSVEIEFNGEPVAFQIDSDISSQVSGWDEGITVKFQYKESTLEADGQQLKQRTLVSIDKQ